MEVALNKCLLVGEEKGKVAKFVTTIFASMMQHFSQQSACRKKTIPGLGCGNQGF